MIDFLTQNAIYVVLACATIIWLGVAVYLWRLEKRVTDLERRTSR